MQQISEDNLNMSDQSEEKIAGVSHIPDVHQDQIHESHHPPKVTASQYAATRITTLKPPMNKAPNPFSLLAMLSGKQWLFFFVGFIAWVRKNISMS